MINSENKMCKRYVMFKDFKARKSDIYVLFLYSLYGGWCTQRIQDPLCLVVT